MKNLYQFILIICLTVNLFAQTPQIDIEWPTLADSPWPMIKHDPQFTGRSPFKGPQTPTIVWTADMKDGIYSGPVIGEEGNLYFGSYYQFGADVFYSYSPVGDPLWNYQFGTNRPPQAGILIDSSNTIYFGSLDGHFYAMNPDGTLKWKYSLEPLLERTYPNIDLNGNIYFTTSDGYLYSLKPDGTLNWKLEGFRANSPAISPDGETIYIPGTDSSLFALNLDGSLKWEFTSGKIWFAPIIDSDGNLYFSPEGDPDHIDLYCVTPEGNVKWSYNQPDRSPYNTWSIPTLDHNGNVYYMGWGSTSSKRALISLDSDGNFRWSYIFTADDEIRPSEEFTQPLICDSEGTIYLGSTFGYYYYAISSDGKLKWELPLNYYQVDNTGAIGKDGTLYLGLHISSLGTNQERTLIAIRDTTTTNVKEEELPTEFSLSQNYPNPFNPTTKIKFTVPPLSRPSDTLSPRERDGVSATTGRGDFAKVQLVIYDILGREIKTLIKKTMQPGEYEVTFNASGLPSGVYFYRLKAGGFVETKKMMLIR